MKTSLILLRSSHSLFQTPINMYTDSLYSSLHDDYLCVLEANLQTGICAAPLIPLMVPPNALCMIDP